MKRSYLPLVVEGTEYGLRLTIAGQRRLKERWQEESLQFLLSAATEPDKLCDLLTQALAGERLPPLGEAFPFWSEEELRQARLEHYRQVMERHAGRGGKEYENGT